ncbi:MAG: N-acetyl-gamma-glutamyl-phosphate reductase [Elusimicrobia bacterium]|nr:N-acetyl-gamma-glutamyl-phosphate reductase [Elusimicrobiota bacterium]
MIRAAVIGVKGYAGEELIKNLIKHPKAKISFLTGRMEGKPKHISEIYPYLKDKLDILCEDIDVEKIAGGSDIIFTALPHNVSMEYVAKFISLGKKVIDLSADYRIKDPDVYEKWYGKKHTNPELLNKAVYGLPELYREKIKKADLIANPGCYPISTILGCYPAIKEKIADIEKIIVDSKSGISGGGRKFVKEYKSPNTYAYKIGGHHRHIPEIEQELSQIASTKAAIKICFTPHIIPQERGLLSTIYLNLKKDISQDEIVKVYRKYYENEVFTRVVESAQTKNVENTNYCEVAVNKDNRTNVLIVTSVIDNLGSGASQQAIQNMNLMYGFDEKEGLI